MVKDADKENLVSYLNIIDGLWRFTSCECNNSGCSCKKANELVNKVIGKIDKLVEAD